MSGAATLPTLTELLHWLDVRLHGAELFRPGHTGAGHFRAGHSAAQIRTLALALEPGDLPPHSGSHDSPDALFLHRAFRLGAAFPGLPVLASHDGFDAQLTTGVNRALAARLSWQEEQLLEGPDGARGLIAGVPQTGWPQLLAALDAELGGHEYASAPGRAAGPLRVALMNAMRPALMDLCAEQGVDVYLTGDLRRGALERARENGLGVVALGHRRTELWGLRQLARELEEAFPGLRASAYPGA